MQGPFDYSRSGGWDKVLNSANSEIPGRGVMRITGTSILAAGDVCYTVDQPNSYGDTGFCLINGPTSIPSGGFGCARRTGNLIAVYDNNDGTPLYGDYWGPRSGTFKLKKNTGGFFCLGAPTNTTQFLALFMPRPMNDFYGQNQSSRITKGNFGNIEIFYRTGGGIVDTGVAMGGCYARFGDIPQNAFVQCFYDTSANVATPTWYAVQMDQCP